MTVLFYSSVSEMHENATSSQHPQAVECEDTGWAFMLLLNKLINTIQMAFKTCFFFSNNGNSINEKYSPLGVSWSRMPQFSFALADKLKSYEDKL